MSVFTFLRDSGKVLENLDDVTCPVCLEIFDTPMRICCGHAFCHSCLVNCACKGTKSVCPLCRTSFDPVKKMKAIELEKKISTCRGICLGCKKKIALSKLRAHHMSCLKLDKDDSGELGACGGEPEPEKPVLSDIPNRFTFNCPYCSLKNLDVHGLRDHCNQKHTGNKTSVVCPVCASMPWGDPQKKSANFLIHLNLRHKFEYEFFVDYNLDDSTALQKALEASLKDL